MTTQKKTTATPKRPAAKKPAARAAAVKQPQDHKAPAAAAKPKVKIVDGAREITMHGVTVSIADSALANPRTLDDLDLIQEAGEDAERNGEDGVDQELQQEAMRVVAGMSRRLFGFAGSRAMHAALEREHGAEYGINHVIEFIFEVFEAVNPS